MVGDVIRQISGYRGQGLSRQVYNQVRFNHAVKGPWERSPMMAEMLANYVIYDQICY